MARPRRKTLREVLGLHQFDDVDEGGCLANDGFGLYASPPVSDGEQMADHQIEALTEARVVLTEHEQITGLMNSLGGTDPMHFHAARALVDAGYGVVRLRNP